MRASKGYVVDTGLIANRDNALIQENYGWRLENVVYIELLRRAAPLFRDIYYYKPSSRGKEVDFAVCEQGRVKQLIQVAYYIDSPKTFMREVEALVCASEALRCNDLYLISFSPGRDETINGKTIHIRNLELAHKGDETILYKASLHLLAAKRVRPVQNNNLLVKFSCSLHYHSQGAYEGI